MYKKNQVVTAKIDSIEFPCTGVARLGQHTLKIKEALPGQIVSAQMKRRRNESIEARLIEVLERPEYEIEALCPHFGACGGCRFQNVPYEKQLEMKEEMVLSLFERAGIAISGYRGISASPESTGYRNKMEFSFGDTGPGGELSLGLRKKNSWYEVVHTSHCKIAPKDMGLLLSETLCYFRQSGTPYYSTRRREGILRHLVVRMSQKGHILVNLVTTSDIADELVEGFKDAILSLELSGVITGILHTKNDSIADTVKLEDTALLYGDGFFYETLMGLSYKITPESFFQTNTLGAEVLYKTALDFAGECKIVYDLYSGTGTITQLLSLCAEKAVGVEIVEEAVKSARETAVLNSIANAEFICGDVLDIVEKLPENTGRPDLIVLDPPRDGVNPKALKIIAAANVDRLIYISCKPTSLVRDLRILAEYGYYVNKCAIVDMFPGCAHVESVVLLTKAQN